MKLLLPADRLTKKQIFDRRWLIAGVMNLALVMVVMAVSSVNVALPTLARDLGATARDLQWIVDSYALVFAGLLLTTGAIGDRYGRRGAFFAGLGVFFIASIFSGLAETSTQLIAWRGLMGVGAALIMPATLSIITNVFPAKDRPKAVAMWAGFAGAGGSIGPVISGLLLQNFWWGSIFLFIAPITIVVAVLAYMYVPSSKDPEEQALDIPGSVLSMLGLSALLFGIIEGPEVGWTSATFIISMAVALSSFVGFVVWEKKTAAPMLPMYLFKSRLFSVSSTVMMASFFTMFGVFFLLTQYLQFVLGDTPLMSAVKTLPMAGTFVLFSQLGPKLVERFSLRDVMATGLMLVAAGILTFTQLSVDSPYLQLLASLLVMGFGMSIVMPLATDGIISSVPKRKAGVGSAVNDTTRELGGAVGIAILGSILATGYRSAIDGKLSEYPHEVSEVASESIGGAYVIALNLGDQGAGVLEIAGEAFVEGMSQTFLVGGLIVVAASFVVLAFLKKTDVATITQE